MNKRMMNADQMRECRVEAKLSGWSEKTVATVDKPVRKERAMPRPKSGPKERWVADIPAELSARAHALRGDRAKWFTKSLMLESAMQAYCEAAERDGVQSLPPFKKVVKPEGRA